MNALQIRRASPKDAAGIVEVLEAVAAERIHTAIDQVGTVEQEVRYLESLSRREILHVAVDATAGVVQSGLTPLAVHTGSHVQASRVHG
jgi:hypothetical protein